MFILWHSGAIDRKTLARKEGSAISLFSFLELRAASADPPSPLATSPRFPSSSTRPLSGDPSRAIAHPPARRLVAVAMPATRRSTRLLSTPSGPTSVNGNGQLLTPDSAPPAAHPAPITAPGTSPLGRLTFRATRRRAAPPTTKPKLALPPTPKSPTSVLSVPPEAILAAVPAHSPDSAQPVASSSTSTMVPPVLSFSFDAAREHLVAADPRFGPLFATYRVTPYQDLSEPVDIWRYVSTCAINLSRRCHKPDPCRG